MTSTRHQEALAKVNAGQLRRLSGYYEIPTAVFVDALDVNLPALPAVAFYIYKNDRHERIREAAQAFPPLALTLHESIWVREEEFAAVKQYTEGLLLNPKANPAMPAERRMDILRQSAMLVVDDLFEHPTPENVNRSVKMVGSFVYVMMKEPSAYLLLAKLSTHDPYTLQHSVGTAVHCIILAKKVGITDEKDLLEVGMAGLLHDIGKVHVKKEIINKQGPLDELEWEEMRQHSQEGYEILKSNPELSERTKRAVLEHHENGNGTGYPSGKKDAEIDIFSKIVCICDVFNALTTDRTYAQARSTFDAFQFMKEKLMHKIDADLFKQLVLVYSGKINTDDLIP